MEPTSPRPLTSYAALLPPPFSSNLHLSVKETARSRASLHDTPTNPQLRPAQSVEMPRLREENRLKRTIEGLPNIVGKVARKIGFSRPLRSDTVQPVASSSAASKRWSTENSVASRRPSTRGGLKRTVTGHRRSRGSRSSNTTRVSLEKISRPGTSVGDSAIDMSVRTSNSAPTMPGRQASVVRVTASSADLIENHAFRIQQSARAKASFQQMREPRPLWQDRGSETTTRQERMPDAASSTTSEISSPSSSTTTSTSASPSLSQTPNQTPILSNTPATSSCSSPDITVPMQRQRVRSRAAHASPSPVEARFPSLPFPTHTYLTAPQNGPPPLPSPRMVSYPSLYFSASAGAGARAAVHSHNMSSRFTTIQPQHSQSLLVPEPQFQLLPPMTVFNCAYCEQAGKVDQSCSWQSCETLRIYETRRRDPAKVLPIEVLMITFGHLDIEDLGKAARVSKAWNDVAITNTVWRDVYRKRFMPSKYRSHRSYMQVGGMGIGLDDRSPRDWNTMSKARLALEKNWKDQNPAAIYFNGHTDSVYCCQFDENKIITGSRDRTIRVWDMETYRCIKVIGGPQYRPVAASSSTPPLEKHQNCVVNVESVNGTQEGNDIYHVPEYYHDASVLCLQFDDRIMVTGSSDHTCIVWDVKTFQPIHRLRFHLGGVLDICFDEKYIISCSKDQNICVWSRTTYELLHVLDEHYGPVNAIQLRGDTLLSGAGDGRALLWCLKTFQVQKVFDTRDRGLAAVELTEDGRHALVGGNEYVVRKYSTKSCKQQHDYSGHMGLVRTLHADCTNRRIVTGSYDQSVRVWDFETGESMGNYANWTTSWILSIKSDYRRIVATSQDGRVLLMDFGYHVPDIDLLKNSKSSHGYWDFTGKARNDPKHLPPMLPDVSMQRK